MKIVPQTRHSVVMEQKNTNRRVIKSTPKMTSVSQTFIPLIYAPIHLSFTSRDLTTSGARRADFELDTI